MVLRGLVLVALFLFPALLQGPAAWAAEITADSRITAVTVFRDRAEITRRFRLSLPAGQHVVVLPELPANLIADSLRASGQAAGELLIGSVEARQRFAEEEVREEERRLRAEIEALGDRRRAQQDRIAAARLTLEFIANMARSAPQGSPQGGGDGRLNPQVWEQAFALLGDGAARAHEEVRAGEIETRDLERQIQRKERELGQIRTGRTSALAVRIAVESATAQEAEMALTYQLPGASWRPGYDARLDTESGRTTLVQMAEVRQRSGEDWSGVALTLSTARPSGATRLPELDPWFIDFRPPPILAKTRRSLQLQAEPELAEEAFRDQAAGTAAPTAAAPAPVEAKAKTAEIVAGEFAAEYRIPGRAEVPADNAPHRFVIAERTLESRLAVRTVPKIDPAAYLYGAVTYAGESPLLPGPVAIFRDGAFVGRTALDFLRPGEALELSFGVDDKVRVEYRLETGEKSSEGLINKRRREERRYLVKIANHHARAIEITLLDQLPVPRDEEIAVERLPDTTRPSEEDFDDRKGVLAWRETFEPQEERTVRFGYAVTYPEGRPPAGF